MNLGAPTFNHAASGGLLPRFERALFVLVVGLALTLFAPVVRALQVPPLEGRVNDRAHLLSASAVQRLESELLAYERATGHQLAVLTIPSLEGDPIEDFGIRVVETWKLGKRGIDDGVLVLVAAGDRKMRIEVGYGLEGDLPDAVASRIVREVMAPRFRAGDFDGGISAAVDAIVHKTGGTAISGARDGPEGTEVAKKPSGPLGRALGFLLRLAFFGVFGVALLFFLLANWFGGPRGGIFIGGGGFGAGARGGLGDGGFSGGGGSFGGGGASGNW